MDLRLVTLSALLFPYISYLIIRHCSRWFFAHRHGCKPAPALTQKDPFFGLDLILRLLSSLTNHQHNRSVKEQVEACGNTFTSKPYGKIKIFTVEPENIQAVFAKDFDKWGVRPLRLFAFRPFVGEGIMDSDGVSWASARALLRPAFSRSQISDLSSFGVHVNRVIDMVPKDGTTVDLQPIFARLGLDSSTEFLFGESVGSLTPSGGTVDAKAFLAAYNHGQAGIGKRMQLPYWNFFTRDPRFWASCQTARNFVKAHVDNALLLRTGKATENTKKLVLAHELAKETKNRDEILNQLLNIFLPAHDAVAVVLTNTMFHLARHPMMWTKLRDELAQQGLLACREEEITFERLKGLKYLQQVMNETFRLNPSIGTISRAALCDTILPVGGGPRGLDPVFVGKGEVLCTSLYALHRRKDIFGEDADQFRPDRWDTLRPRPWSYLPFGGGPRMCIGQQIALSQVGFTLVRFLQTFRCIENRDPVQDFVEVFKITTESKNGAKVGFEIA